MYPVYENINVFFFISKLLKAFFIQKMITSSTVLLLFFLQHVPSNSRYLLYQIRVQTVVISVSPCEFPCFILRRMHYSESNLQYFE